MLIAFPSHFSVYGRSTPSQTPAHRHRARPVIGTYQRSSRRAIKPHVPPARSRASPLAPAQRPAAAAELARDDQPRDGRLHLPLNGPLERARAEDRVIADPRQISVRLLVDLDGDAALGETSPKPLELDLHDLFELRLGEGAKDHDFVHAVQELRPELAAQGLEDLLPHALVGPVVGAAHLQYELAADI